MTVPRFCFLLASILICASTHAGESNPLLNLNVPIPDDIKIVSPDGGLLKEIAAFSGLWKGKWPDYNTETVLVVEEINSKEAKVIYCLEEMSSVYTIPASCERYKAAVVPEKLRIEFGIGDTQFFTYTMGKNLEQITATKKTPLDLMETMMTKIKE